uniref:MAM domain-containing protein n=1 Tax=Heterorhabditis bacteriophora TaxID=37862 RepID=A0A1I7XQI6_HETBA
MLPPFLVLLMCLSTLHTTQVKEHVAVVHHQLTVSELECIATWHFLGHTFFAARVGGRRGEAFRCFITEKTGTMGRIGISADAGCQELTHIGAASVILHYKHGTRHEINQGMLISSYKGRNDTVWTCIEKKEAEQGNFIRAHVRKGCQTGYQCMLEVCPFQRSHISPLCSLPVLWMGCEEKDEMHMLRECRENKGERFSCVAHFPHEEYQFIVVRSEETKKTQCLTYISTPVMLLRVFDHISCDPISIQGALPALQMNISSIDTIESYFSSVSNTVYTIRGSNVTSWLRLPWTRADIVRMAFTDPRLQSARERPFAVGEYDDKYDLMSTANAHMRPSTYGLNGPGLNGPHLDYLGWLPMNRMVYFGRSCRDGRQNYTLRLSSLSVPHRLTIGWLMVMIPYDRDDPGNVYTVEYRTPVGNDAGIRQGAVVIHKVHKIGMSYYSTLITHANNEYNELTAGTEWIQFLHLEKDGGFEYIRVKAVCLASDVRISLGSSQSVNKRGVQYVCIEANRTVTQADVDRQYLRDTFFELRFNFRACCTQR